MPLGLYLHIPFCRKRCHFCYFRVYTDKNAREVEQYLDLPGARMGTLCADDRGRGSAVRLRLFWRRHAVVPLDRAAPRLVDRLTAAAPWNGAEEITFECEPGTLTEAKLAAIRSMGVTRLSLGVENFDDRILELNGRAHRSPEIGRAYAFARSLGFPQINIDLIAGMLGETDDNWRACIDRTLALDPDSVTIYQMELPYNTTISGDILKGTRQFDEPVANWATKRRWVEEAFRGARTRRLSHRQRLHRGQESVEDQVRLSRSPVGRRRPARPRRRVVRTRQRRPHAEPRHVGEVQAAIERDEIPLGRAYRPTTRNG